MSNLMLCVYCQSDMFAAKTAEKQEEHWRRHPVTVADYLCPRCQQRRHWWFFLWEDQQIFACYIPDDVA